MNAAACKAAYIGPIPFPASKSINQLLSIAAQKLGSFLRGKVWSMPVI